MPKQKIFVGPDFSGVKDYAAEIGYPVCVKGDNGFKWMNVFSDIGFEDELREVVGQFVARKEKFVVEEHVFGNYYRLNLVGNKVIYSRSLGVPLLIGDGVRSIGKLIDETNPLALKYPEYDVRHYTYFEITDEVKMLLSMNLAN